MADRPYLGSSLTFWPTPRGPWGIELHFAASETGAPICVGADLRSFTLADKGRVARLRGKEIDQLTAQVWRSVPIQTKIAEEIAGFISTYQDILGKDTVVDRSARRAGPKSFWTKERLRHVAAIYRANIGTRAPTRAVAEAFGVSPSMGAKLVARAREQGLLGATSSGRIGDEPRKKRPPTSKRRTKK